MGLLAEQVVKHIELLQIIQEALKHLDTIKLGPDELTEIAELASSSFFDEAAASVFREWMLTRDDFLLIERACMYKEFFE